jgi:PAS domain S-box-containing protein
MYAINELVLQPPVAGVDDAIDTSCLTVSPESRLFEVITRMNQHQGSISYVLVVENSRSLGWFAATDLIQLLANGVDLQAVKISEVMNRTLFIKKKSEITSIISVFSLLRELQSPFLVVVDEQELLQGIITLESICQTLEVKQVEEANQVGLFQQLLEKTNEVFFVRDVKEETVDYFHPTDGNIWGWDTPLESENIQSPSTQELIDAIYPEDRDRVITAIEQQSLDEVYHQEYRIIRPDGETRWISARTFPIKNKLGEVSHVVGIAEDITKFKEVETQLQLVQELLEIALSETQDRFLSLFNSISQYLWFANKDGLVEFCNQYGLDYLGCDFADALGDEWQKWVHPEDLPSYLTSWQYSVATGNTFETEVRLLSSSNNTYRWYRVHAIPLPDSQGNIFSWFGTNTDIHKRKIMEESLQLSEERSLSIVEIASDIIWEVDENFAFTYISPQTYEILGYKPEEVIGKTPFEAFFSPDEVQRVANIIMPLVTNQEAFQKIEVRKNHKNGTHIVMEISGAPIFNADGKYQGYRGVGVDRTEQKNAENLLHESEESLRLLIEGVKDYAILMLDVEGKITTWNSGVESITGYKAEELIGQHFSCFFSPEDIANQVPQQEIEIATTTGRYEVNGWRIRQNGSLFWANVVISGLYQPNGELKGFAKITRDITEQRKAEIELLKFRKVIECTGDAVCITDDIGYATYINPAFKQLLGYEIPELNQYGGLHRIYTFLNKSMENSITITSGLSWQGEILVCACDDRNLPMYLRADAVRDPETNEIIAMIGIHTDFSEQKFLEQELNLRDRAMTASRDGMVIVDMRLPDKPLSYVNKAFEEMSGYSLADAIGQNSRFLYGRDRNQPEFEQLRQAISKAQECTVIIRNYRRDGTMFWNKLSVSPVFNKKRKLTHYIGIQTDISDRVLMEMRLRISKTRLEYLLSSSPGALYTLKIHPEFNTSYISPNVSNLLGYSDIEFIENAQLWKNNIHTEDKAQVLLRIPEILKAEKFSQEYRFVHQDGNYRWLLDQCKLICDEAGNPLEIIGFLTDITQIKELEEDLKIALEREKELNELKSRFVSMTSHEFRTPLSTILSSSELLEHYRHKWTLEKQTLHLHRIQSSVQHLTKLLNDVLTIGQAEAGKFNFKPSLFNFVDYFHNLVEETQINIRNSHTIEFLCECQFTEAYMDKILLEHIFSNLLSNAIKYSPINSTIKFAIATSNHDVIFVIKDQGIGIPQEDLPHLFDSFHRATNVGNIQGTGLGLSIVKKCVDIHQGTIKIDSELNIGTTFTLTLPLDISKNYQSFAVASL